MQKATGNKIYDLLQKVRNDITLSFWHIKLTLIDEKKREVQSDRDAAYER